LTGETPKELGHIIPLFFLNLAQNAFAGTVPVELFELPFLGGLTLGRNLLTGELPFSSAVIMPSTNQSTNTTLQQPSSNIFYLNLSGNQLSDSIPEDIGSRMNRLQSLVLANNFLGGPIPSSRGSMKSLIQVWLMHNGLTGT
jgi:Leucine-rich repeat (LRR) protein